MKNRHFEEYFLLSAAFSIIEKKNQSLCDQVSSQLKQSKIKTTFNLSSSILLYLLQMSTSGGGGYCDCGDIEAWKAHPYCELHNIDSKPSSDQVCFSKGIIRVVIRD
jgi:hypothetical protein